MVGVPSVRFALSAPSEAVAVLRLTVLDRAWADERIPSLREFVCEGALRLHRLRRLGCACAAVTSSDQHLRGHPAELFGWRRHEQLAATLAKSPNLIHSRTY